MVQIEAPQGKESDNKPMRIRLLSPIPAVHRLFKTYYARVELWNDKLQKPKLCEISLRAGNDYDKSISNYFSIRALQRVNKKITLEEIRAALKANSVSY